MPLVLIHFLIKTKYTTNKITKTTITIIKILFILNNPLIKPETAFPIAYTSILYKLCKFK